MILMVYGARLVGVEGKRCMAYTQADFGVLHTWNGRRRPGMLIASMNIHVMHFANEAE